MDKPSKVRTPAPEYPTRLRGGEVGIFVKYLFPLGCRRGFLFAKIY